MKQSLIFARSIILCFCLYFPSTFLNAQTGTWGPEFKERRRVGMVAMPGNIDGYTYVVMGERNPSLLFSSTSLGLRSVIIKKMDANLQIVKENKLDLPALNTAIYVQQVLKFDRKLFLMMNEYDNALNTTRLLAQEIDQNTLTLLGEPRQIGEVRSKNFRRQGTFTYYTSPNKSLLAVVSIPPSHREEEENYSLTVFGPEFFKMWTSEIRLPYESRLFVQNQLTIDNGGNAFILGRLFRDKIRLRRQGEPNYNYKLVGYFDQGQNVREYTIDVRDKFITDVRLKVAGDGSLIASGFYSNLNTFNVIGTFFRRIDPETSEILASGEKDIAEEYFAELATDREERKANRRKSRGKETELAQYDLREIIARSDGGSLLIAEQYYVTEATYSDPRTGMIQTTYIYHYNDLILVSVAPTGSIEWVSKVPKRQVTTDDGGYYSSYVAVATNEMLYIVYNDNVKNLTTNDQGDKLKNFSLRDKNGIVAVAEVDFAGNVNRRRLLSNTDIETIVVPKFCEQISSDELLIYTQRRKLRQFGKIEF